MYLQSIFYKISVNKFCEPEQFLKHINENVLLLLGLLKLALANEITSGEKAHVAHEPSSELVREQYDPDLKARKYRPKPYEREAVSSSSEKNTDNVLVSFDKTNFSSSAVLQKSRHTNCKRPMRHRTR